MCVEDYDSNENSTAWRTTGSLRWQAPELFENPKRTTASDIFAFGRVTYEVFGILHIIHKDLPTIYLLIGLHEGCPFCPHLITLRYAVYDDQW